MLGLIHVPQLQQIAGVEVRSALDPGLDQYPRSARIADVEDQVDIDGHMLRGIDDVDAEGFLLLLLRLSVARPVVVGREADVQHLQQGEIGREMLHLVHVVLVPALDLPLAPDVPQPFVHPGFLEEPGIVADMPGQTELCMGIDVLGREGGIGQVGLTLLDLHVEGQDDAQGIGLVIAQGKADTSPVGRAAFHPPRFAVVPELFPFAEKGEGYPLPQPGLEDLASVQLVTVTTGRAPFHDAVQFAVAFLERMEHGTQFVALLDFAFLEVAADAQSFQRCLKVEQLGAAIGDQADSLPVFGHGKHDRLSPA